MDSDREGSLGSDAMEEEMDDDLYGDSNGSAQPIKAEQTTAAPLNGQNMKIQEEEDDEDEDSDDSDDLQVITESKNPKESLAQFNRYGQAVTKPDSVAAGGLSTQQPQRPTSTQPSQQQATSKQSAGAVTQSSIPQTTQSSLHVPSDLTLHDGRTHPEVRTSTIDLKGDPLYNGKPISTLEIDADLAEHLKPWRAPGADQTDYFNYGFDEFTWAQYVLKRKEMKGELDGLSDQKGMFEMMMTGMMPGMGGPGQGGANGQQQQQQQQPQQQGSGTPNSAQAGGQQNNPMAAMTGMMGMPNNDEMMQAMAAAMQSQGVSDPSQLDFGTFMQGFGMGGPGVGVGGAGRGGGVPSGPSGWHNTAGGRRGGRGGNRGFQY